MDSRTSGLLLVGLGLLLVLVGLLVWSGALGWVGRLPGDVRIERGPVRVYFPIASMLLASLVLSLALYIARRFF